MTDPQVALLMLGIFVATILLGFPIAFTLIAMAMMFGYYAYYDAFRMQHFLDNRIFDLLVNQTYSVMTNEVLVAVPLFLFMGYVVERANIVDRLFYSLNIAARALPGAMALAALFTCAIFATASGIVGAVVTLMGLLAFPALLKAGYDQRLSAGVICAGGCLGILIPPSIMLIVYAAASGVSVVRLYAGAMLPGLLLAGLYMLYVVGRAVINPKLAPKPPREQTDIPITALLWMILTSFVPLALLIFAVLGSILFGLATPTEAAAMGAFGSLLLAATYRLSEVYDGRATPQWAAEAAARNSWLTAVGVAGVIVVGAYGAYVVARVLGTNWLGLPPMGRHLPGAPGQMAAIALATAVAIYLFVHRIPALARLMPKRKATRAILDAVGWGTLVGLALGVAYLVGVNLLGLDLLLYRREWTVYGADIGYGIGGGAALLWRGIEWERLKESVFLTVRTSAMVCWLFVGSWTFASVFSYLGGHDIIEHFVLSLELTPLQFLIMAQLIIFLLGWPLEWSEIIIIFVPIFLPLLPAFGVDPLFFGILVALNLQTSFMTPPMAMAAYYLKGVAPPHVELMEIFKGCFPFLFMVLICMIVLYNFPGIALFLPEYFYGVASPR